MNFLNSSQEIFPSRSISAAFIISWGKNIFGKKKCLNLLTLLFYGRNHYLESPFSINHIAKKWAHLFLIQLYRVHFKFSNVWFLVFFNLPLFGQIPTLVQVFSSSCPTHLLVHDFHHFCTNHSMSFW